MGRLIDKYSRDRAVDASIEVLKHQSNRAWDRMADLDAMLGRAQDPEKVLAAIQELNGLIGGMRMCVQVWKMLRADFLKNENEKPEPTSIGDNPTAPECTCTSESGIHTPECPRGKWISDVFDTVTPPAPATVPEPLTEAEAKAAAAELRDDDIPF